MNFTNTSQAPCGCDNSTLTVCSPSSMSTTGIVATTFLSLVLYGLAFFIMSTAVGNDPRVTSIASWKNNCVQFYQFLSNTIGGIFFCSNGLRGGNGAGRSNEFEIPASRRRTALAETGSSSSGGRSRRGFQLLSAASADDNSATNDVYAENNQPSTETES